MAQPSPENLIEGRNVTKIFRDFWGRPKVRAVTDVSFAVRAGSITGLLGPNGAGKSTLLKMILGHLYPSSGHLQVLGKDPRDVDSKRRLGYLPERAYLYKNLTAEETLLFFGEILELPRAEARRRADQLLAMVGLGRSHRRLVGEFSHGMMRRMGLAQALLNDPDLLLLDEPTAGLDPIGCREVKDLILTLARRGKTVLMTSHLLADMEDTCDQIMVMFGGHKLAQGTIGELLREEATLQVTLPAVAPERLAALRTALAAFAPPDQIQVGAPTRSLEEYFLQVVRDASAKHETSGAQIGAGVADYLRRGVAATPDESAAAEQAAETVLADLAGEPPKPAPTPAAPAETIDRETLDHLTAEPSETPEPESRDDDVDDDLLDQLSGRN